MNRYEYIKNASIEDMAKVLCLISEYTCDNCECGCEECIATKHCKNGKNGFIHWLEKEAKF